MIRIVSIGYCVRDFSMTNIDVAQYKGLFIKTSIENLVSFNDSFEKYKNNTQDHDALDLMFRSIHSIKGKSLAIGYEAIGELAREIEEVLYNVKEGKISFNNNLKMSIEEGMKVIDSFIHSVKFDNTQPDVHTQIENIKKAV